MLCHENEKNKTKSNVKKSKARVILFLGQEL